MYEIVSSSKVILSIVSMVSIVLLRWIVIWRLKKRTVDEDSALVQKSWINTLRNISNLLIVAVLIFIWLSEIQYFALSIAAFIVALVIATREFIQCVLGAFYIASARLFTIGDWVKVGPHYGEVINSNWLCTTLMEVDIESLSYAYTGKTLVVPNNQMVSHSVHNLNFMRRYICHSFTLTRDPDLVNLFDAKQFILDKANEYCASFSEVALRYNNLLESKMGITLPGPEPDVRIATTTMGKNQFTVSVFCPTNEAVGIEQRLTQDFMQYWYSAVTESKMKKSNDKNSVEEAVNTVE